ncbi:MAG: TIM barrel protein [Planctomycetia bacterium]|nr:TIM barrel protein [Planctomycetia bacterium]
MAKRKNVFPKLHNATWPGVVGKGTPDSEPCISLEKMMQMTVAAEVNEEKFDGIDLFLASPHFDLDQMDQSIDILEGLVEKYKMEVGSMVAPIWAGSTIGSEEKRNIFLDAVRKSCILGKKLREKGIRPNGCIRIDSSCSVDDWLKDPEENQKQIVKTFISACDIAAEYDEMLAAEGEICWGGMHSWKRMLQILECVDRPQVLGFQADMSHTLLYLLGYNAPEDRLLPENFDFSDTAEFDAAYARMTRQLRPWTIDLHIAQNDGSVYGSGSHDKTGRHCLPKDPNGKLDIVKYAGYWLKDEDGLLKRFNHICWDGCMFSNAIMENPQTWNDVLEAMSKVRTKYGWK